MNQPASFRVWQEHESGRAGAAQAGYLMSSLFRLWRSIKKKNLRAEIFLYMFTKAPPGARSELANCGRLHHSITRQAVSTMERWRGAHRSSSKRPAEWGPASARVPPWRRGARGPEIQAQTCGALRQIQHASSATALQGGA
jgi:hypothetical protein